MKDMTFNTSNKRCREIKVEGICSELLEQFMESLRDIKKGNVRRVK